jgi:hypothetical protein
MKGQEIAFIQNAARNKVTYNKQQKLEEIRKLLKSTWSCRVNLSSK